jgi:hypothetical protein
VCLNSKCCNAAALTTGASASAGAFSLMGWTCSLQKGTKHRTGIIVIHTQSRMTKTTSLIGLTSFRQEQRATWCHATHDQHAGCTGQAEGHTKHVNTLLTTANIHL